MQENASITVHQIQLPIFAGLLAESLLAKETTI